MTGPPPNRQDDDPPATLTWSDDGAPRSQAFDDIYFQPGEGLSEARAVFLQGCGLPQAWKGRDRFTVAELGFGSGLNILALLELWRRERAPGQRLNIFSVEAFPLGAEDARRALSVWPELADLSERLLTAWPRRASGFHRIDLPHLNATLDVAVAEAADALRLWTGRADAWFLDGFSPAKNPRMWSEQVMALVAARSAPGARAATFTVAGNVRRALIAAGFTVERLPGHGRKRQRLEARLDGQAPSETPVGRVAVVGNGIAAAGLIRALSAQGVAAVQVSAPGSGASGNPAALVMPGLDAGEGVGGRLYAQALARAFDLYQAIGPSAVIATGVAQLEKMARDGPRFDRVATSRLFAPGAVERLDADGVAARLGEPAQVGGLWLSEGLVVEPAAIQLAWATAQRIEGVVDRLERIDRGWRLLDAQGAVLAEAEVVCLAAGPSLRALAGLTLDIIRGQASWTDEGEAGVAAAWGGYATPTRRGVLFGATHDRGDEDVSARPVDDERNLAQLHLGRPNLAAAVRGRPTQARAALRVAAHDRLPVAGALPATAGLFVLGALGSRGFTSAPLLAEHVVALVLGAPSPLPADIASAVDPGRLTSG